MKSTDVKNAITTWTTWASSPGVDRYDIALFKIWIQLEKFLGELFMNYSIGLPSETGYYPSLKIQFHDEEHFNVFMRGEKKYVDYLDKIEKLSKHVFYDNPFDVILADSINKPAFDQMKAIRNYIAHESGESKSKIINTCFCGNEKKFLEPNDYLKSKEKSSKNSYYTYYTNIINGVVDLVIINSGATF